MKKHIEKVLNKIALDTTGYDICSIEDFNTPEEAIDYHLDWLRQHFTDVSQSFENEVRRFRD